MAGSGAAEARRFAAGGIPAAGEVCMKHRAGIACVLMGASLCLAATARSEEKTEAVKPTPTPGERVVVDVRSDRILLLDAAQVGKRLIAVGERGFALVSDDGGK